MPQHVSSTANKGQSTLNYCQSLAFDCTYLSCNDHCDQWLFQKTFFLLILNLFLRNSFEQSWTCFWNTFTKHKEQVCFLFICSFFTCCFVIILHINALHLFIFSTAHEHTGWVCSLFDCCSAITLCNNALHLLYLDGFNKTNPSSISIFLMKLKFSFNSAEIRMPKLPKV